MKKQLLNLVLCFVYTTPIFAMELDHTTLQSAVQSSRTLAQIYAEIKRDGCKNPHCFRNNGQCYYHQDQADRYYEEIKEHDQQPSPDLQVQSLLKRLNEFFPLLQPRPVDAPDDRRMYPFVYFEQLTQFLNLEVWCAQGGSLNKALACPFTKYQYAFKDIQGLRAFFKISTVDPQAADTFEVPLRKWIEQYEKELLNPSFSESERWEHKEAVKECTRAVSKLEKTLNDKKTISTFIKEIPDAIQQKKDDEALRKAGECCIS